jgi:hypothetical protein
MIEMRNAYKILVGKLNVKRSLGRPRRIWEDNIIRKERGKMWTGCIWLETGIGGGLS